MLTVQTGRKLYVQYPKKKQRGGERLLYCKWVNKMRCVQQCTRVYKKCADCSKIADMRNDLQCYMGGGVGGISPKTERKK